MSGKNTSDLVLFWQKTFELNHACADSPVDATTWFLGPKAENLETLSQLIQLAIDAQAQARKNYQPDDPSFNSLPTNNYESQHQQQIAELEEPLKKVLEALEASTPMPSFRNHSHMNWDLTLPSVVGYFAGMLYNSNNVAPEASPVTTALEIQVGKDLCQMVGYEYLEGEEDSIEPWGHITCDGSIANAEAMWAARNLKFLPIAVAAAIRLDKRLKDAFCFAARTLDGTYKTLVTMDAWTLLNLPIDSVLDMEALLAEEYGIDIEVVADAVAKHNVQSIGLVATRERFLERLEHALPIICVPNTAHYSWMKAAALLGLGFDAIELVDVDEDARMDIVALRSVLDRSLENQRPVVQVVAVIGSTEEGAVDPLASILKLRDEFRTRGMEFAVHVDGAWGAYFRTMLLDPLDTVDPAASIDDYPSLQLSDYVRRQLDVFGKTDSVTADPHKSGFIPYPAGGLCYRNGKMRALIKYAAPVVFHEQGEDVNVGAYGIEGSKPGAAAVSTYLSHAVIPLNRLGYGRLLGRCIFNAKRFYAALVSMPDKDDVFTVTPFQRLPAECKGKDPEDEIRFIKQEIVARSNPALFKFFSLSDEDKSAERALDLFKSIGSDLSITTYAFNFKKQGVLNTSLKKMNELNQRIYEKLSLTTVDFNQEGKLPKPPLIVTSSEFDPNIYGQSFNRSFLKRAGIKIDSEALSEPITFLISTTQNPWLTANSEENFLITLMDIYKKEVNNVVAEMNS